MKQNIMKAAMLTSLKCIELTDTRKPAIVNDFDVLVRVKVVGVCGSDVHYFSTGRIGNLVVDYPFTLGHEGAGVVEEAGSRVKSVAPGDEVVIEPSVSCGKCSQCIAGRPHTCLTNKFLGCPGQLEGNLSEYLVIPESQCLKLVPQLTLEHGALSEPLSIGLYANRLANYETDKSIAILGFGPIGMSVMLTSMATNPTTYFVSDKIEERLAIAKNIGATKTVNPLHDDVLKEVKSINHDLIDVVFECCGQQDALDTAFEIVKPGGKIVIVGIPEFDRWTFQADLARRKEVTLIHVRRQNGCVEETLKLMQSGKLDASKMVTHRFSLSQTQEAFNLVSNYQDGVMKALIQI